MSKKQQIEYQDPMSRSTSSSDLSDLNMSFNEITDIVSTLSNNIALTHTQSSEPTFFKKDKKIVQRSGFTIPIVAELLELFHNASIGEDHKFAMEYIKRVKAIIESINISDFKQQHAKIYLIYLHYIFSLIQNLEDMTELVGEMKISPIPKHKKTNIMNVKCILANIESVELEECAKELTSHFNIFIVDEDGVCDYEQTRICISKNYIKKAVESNGLHDLHFGAFLVSRLNSTPLLHHFAFCNGAIEIQRKYAENYEQIIRSDLSSQDDYKAWYDEQINNLFNRTFLIEDLQNKIIAGEKNIYIEKLLVGLQGWNQKMAEESTILLNAYYDNIDWQLSSPFKPVISQVGEKFHIDYLIENKDAHRHNLLFCLKAPCMNNLYQKEVISWHHLKVKQYTTTDNDTFLWVEANFGHFLRCGFFDWKLFELNIEGRNCEVSKILNMSQNKQYGSQIISKKMYSVRPVQGRFIVHPKDVRKLQIHEIYMDSLSSNEGQAKVPSFSDAAKQLKRYSEYGINCAYIMGVFQRDNGKFAGGFKRPQASPIALTSRKHACEMLGGQKGFKQLVQSSHSVSMKIVTDCTDRVSSSRPSKTYEPFRLFYVDESGRKYPFYGSEGRSIRYEDTMILNYRKLEAWNLLIDEIDDIVQKFGIDGIYMDNGISWPQVFEIDLEQMLRKDEEKQPYYSNQAIFEGEVVIKSKAAGFWTTKSCYNLPNPMYIKLVKTLWQKYDNFLFICESFECSDKDGKNISAIQSGLIPRIFKMPQAVAQIVGLSLQQNGVISSIPRKNVIALKIWYQQIKSLLPKNSIIIESTSSHAWPYPAFLFKKATWAFIDLIFFLPQIPMTFIGEQEGRAYRTKTTSIFFDTVQNKHIAKNAQMKKVHSSFFNSESMNTVHEKVVSSVNATIKDPTQIKYLEQAFRREVGPEYGFDLAQIHKHYLHRRKLRNEVPLLTSGKMMALTAEHKYGVHKNILSFAKWNSNEILLISINFNEASVDMHYNLTNFKYIFTKANQSSLIVRVEQLMGKSGLESSLYTVGELLNSRIEAHLEAYQSMIWKLTIEKDANPEDAYACSGHRILKQINSNPPKWIYSSIFTNELSRMVEKTTSIKSFVQKLDYLYNTLIMPYNISFTLTISKTYEFWLNRNKLSKLFGIFKLIDKYPQINGTLKESIKTLLEGNKLGPIAFVTPEIGAWSSVGGLGVMVDQLSKQLAKLGEEVYIITPYYEYNKKKQTNYLVKDGFKYDRNIKAYSAHLSQQFGIHLGKYQGVNYIWFHNPSLFSKPYDGEGALYVTKQLVFFALATLESFCQLKIFPSIIVTNDWMCGFVSAYVKVGKYSGVFDGSKFMHIIHNLDPLYEGRLYPKFEEGDLNWLIQLPAQWYVEYRSNKLIINPSKCAIETCDNWGTVSNSYKYDLLKDSPLSYVLWKHPNPFAFPNGVRKEQRVSIIKTKTPGTHLESKKILQQKYFGFEDLNNDIPILTFIGRVTKQKGVHLIVDSVEALLHEFNFKIQFIVGGNADSKQEYGKYCADRMKYLHHRYPKCFWSNPDAFFTDGSLANIGSDYALMPSLFQPGGIVQHQFFCGSTPVIAFRTGGLKDTVFEYDYKTQKGNGFNFMSYEMEDFKRCIRRSIQCYRNKPAYEKLRENAFDSVVEEEDVAKGWNTEFYRLQNKIYIDWNGVQKQIESLKEQSDDEVENDEWNKIGEKGEFWSQDWDIKQDFKAVLMNAQRLTGKEVIFNYQTQKIPRPKDVCIAGSWNDWKEQKKMNFDRLKKNWNIHFKLSPGTYEYKYVVDGEWVLNKKEQVQIDINGNENHVVVVE